MLIMCGGRFYRVSVYECKHMRESSERKGDSSGEDNRGKHERKHNQPIN